MISPEKLRTACQLAEAAISLSGGTPNWSPLQEKIVFTWVAAAKLYNEAPNPNAIYFGVFRDVPPSSFGSPICIVDFIKAVHAERDLPAITEEDVNQINVLAVFAFKAFDKTKKSKVRKGSSGCAGVILLGILLGVVLASSAHSLM